MSEESEQLPLTQPPPVEKIPVAFTARVVENLIANHISVPLSTSQVENAEIIAKYIEPIIFEIEKNHLNDAVIYSLLASFYYFKSSCTTGPPSHRRLTETRMRVTLKIARHIVHDLDYEALARSLVYEFYPLNQKNEWAISVPRYLRISALEIAVKTEAKLFLMEEPVFNVVNDLWNGILVVENHFDAGSTPRLRNTVTDLHQIKDSRSPKCKHVIQFLSASVYLVVYLLLIQQDPRSTSPITETLFALWSCGYALDEYHQLHEFGTKMYFMSLWNTIDTILVFHCILYGCVRLFSILEPNMFPNSYMVARGILITAGIFIVPRLFSVFDNNKVFSNMVISLQKVSTDFLISWFVVMIFSVGVWVSVAFSVPRVRLYSDSSLLETQADGADNGGARTALAMFKMLFDDASELWDGWFDYTTFDKVALCFYLILAQFIMPTVVISVVTNSFAQIRENSAEEFYYMRAVQALKNVKSPNRHRASSEEVTPFNVIAWVFEWLEVVLPKSVYTFIAEPFRATYNAPSKLIGYLGGLYDLRSRNRVRHQEKTKRDRLEMEVDRSLGDSSSTNTKRKIARQERMETRFKLLNEVFTNKKILRAMEEQHAELGLEIEGMVSNTKNQELTARLSSIEAAVARIEALMQDIKQS